MIHTENKYENLNPNTENSFLSTKNGHAGIGLKNIEMTVKKYNGIWKATVENNSFVVSITIPIDSQPIIWNSNPIVILHKNAIGFLLPHSRIMQIIPV